MRKCFLTFLILCCLGMAASAQADTAAFRQQYARLSKAYAKAPSDVETLVALAAFYTQEENPLHSLPAAAGYIQKAEAVYSQWVEDNDRYNEVLRLIRKKITLRSVRQQAHEIDSLAQQALGRRAAAMSDGELVAYVAAFPHCRPVVLSARAQLVAAAYSRAREENSIEGFYAFLVKYPDAPQADSAEAALLRLGQRYFSQFGDESSIEQAVGRYPASRSLRKCAESLKGRIAFADADRENTVEAFTSYMERYPRGEDYMSALAKLEELRVVEFGMLASPEDYADFAEANSDTPLADTALARLCSMVADGHSASAAETYLRRFPLDPRHGEIYKTYYGWHAAEGNHQPIEAFAKAHPDYPYRLTLEADLQTSAAADTFDLTRPFAEGGFAAMSSCVYKLTGRRLSFVALQRLLQQQIAHRDWEGASARLATFDLCFEQVCREEYGELRDLLAAQEGPHCRMELPAGEGLSHFLIAPSGDRIYFTRTIDGHSTICYAVPAGQKNRRWTYAGEVETAGVEGQPTAYCFFDNGRQALVGIGGDIYCASLLDKDHWKVTEKLPYPVNTDYYDGDAFMLEDGSGLLLASDRPGGHNCQQSGAYFHGDHALATDLYFVPRTPAGWGEAENLGGSINTPYCERSPLMSRNMKTLYFVTDARGLGYGDVYKADRTDVDDWGRWGRPVSLGKAVNGSFDESSISFARREKEILIASSSPQGGRYACYSHATDHDTASNQRTVRVDVRPVSGSIRRLDVIDLNRQTSVATLTSGDIEPIFSVRVATEKPYAVLVQADSVFTPAVVIGKKEGGAAVVRGYSAPQLIGRKEPLRLPLVGFTPRTAHLLPLGELEMQNVGRFLLTNTRCGVEIVVRVPGDDGDACYTLSLQRATVLRNYLVGFGIEADRVRLCPFGNVDNKKGQEESGVSVSFF